MANSLTLNGFLHREVGQVKQTDTKWLSAQGRGYQTPSTGFRYIPLRKVPESEAWSVEGHVEQTGTERFSGQGK